MLEHCITIYGIPRSKKNSSRVVMCGRYPKILPSKAFEEYEKACKPYVPALGINYPVNIEAVFYMDIDYLNKVKKIDLVNLEEALLDVLVKYGCIEDDNVRIVRTMNGSRLDYDKSNPRVEVTITEIGE